MTLLRNLLGLFFVLGYLTTYGQSFDRTVIASAGSTDLTDELSLDWTLGELAVETIHDSELTLSEGFQQSYLTVEEETLGGDDIDIRVSPNPVRNELSVHINTSLDDILRLDLFDVNGRALESLKVDPNIRLVNIDMFNFPAGMYILRIINRESNDLVKSYKITKVN